MRRIALVILLTCAGMLAQTPQTSPAPVSSSFVTSKAFASASVTAGWNAVVEAELSGTNYTYTLSVTDTNGDTFASCAGPASQANIKVQFFCGVFGTTNASEVITLNASSTTGATTLAGSVQIYSGGFTSVDLDTSATGSSGTASSGNITTTHATELLVGGVIDNGNTLTAGSGWTQRVNNSSGFQMLLEDKDVSSTGAYAATATLTSAAWDALIVALYVPPATVANPTISPNGVALGLTSPATTVTLGDTTPGAAICYTENGDTPTATTPGTCDSDSGNEHTYSTTLSISSPLTVKAIGTLSGYLNSGVTSAAFNLYADQTGAYAFSDNFYSYISMAAESNPLSASTSNTSHQLSLDWWNTLGMWTANGTPTISLGGSAAVQPMMDFVRGGSNAELYGGGPSTEWVTYTGATGFNGTSVGQYSLAYFNGSLGGSPSACVYTFSNASATKTGYSLCVSGTLSSGSISFSKTVSGTYTNIAQVAGLTLTAGSTLELRSQNGNHQLLLNGAAVSGLAASYADSTITTGNPGVSGTGLYNWTGGTINATTAPTPISWAGIPGGNFTSVYTIGDPATATYPMYTPYTALADYSVVNSRTLNTGVSEAGTTVTITSTLNPGTGTNNVYCDAIYVGGNNSGYSGTVSVTSSNSSSFQYTAASGLGTPSQLGECGLTTGLSAAGAYQIAGVEQNQYETIFTPAQWVTATINVDTTSYVTQNWFLKLNGNSAIDGPADGGSCYDLMGYYIGVEPEYPLYPRTPPANHTCTGATEYCGTNYLHITKMTPVTQPNGCYLNNDIVTVSGSTYIPMQGDKILAMYQPNGYLDVYCLGGARTALAAAGQGCPSTTAYFRVIHAPDTDMLSAADSSGRSIGYPGVWAASPPLAPGPMPVFTAVSMGSVTSGVTCNTITSSTCVNPVGSVPSYLVP